MWHGSNVRQGGAYIFSKFFYPVMRGGPAPQVQIDLAYNNFYSSLKTIEKIWLPRNSTKKFMFGDQPTIADLALAYELQQFEGIDF